jgi:hypothetical protein
MLKSFLAAEALGIFNVCRQIVRKQLNVFVSDEFPFVHVECRDAHLHAIDLLDCPLIFLFIVNCFRGGWTLILRKSLDIFQIHRVCISLGGLLVVVWILYPC